MGQRIVIDPVTRIEGHAKITLLLDDQGEVSDARFHVVEFRGFEKFCEGRSFREMPGITSRICGICPVSHMLTSAKAGDELLAVEIPEGATRLRRLLHYGQILQSHALSFFHLSSPDFLLGHDSDPAKRNVMGLIAANPEVARRGIRLRQFGQEVIEILAGKKIHSTWVVPGGVDEPLTAAGRDRIQAWLPEAKETIEKTLTFWKREMDRHQDEARVFGNFPSLFMGLVTPDGGLEHYDGKIRFVDATGTIVADQLPTQKFHEYIGEAVEPWTYLKFPYYKPLGYPGGMYRVGPLARLNVASHCGTPLADRELAEFRQLGRGAVLSAFHYHYARLIEILYCVERIEEILAHPDLLTAAGPGLRPSQPLRGRRLLRGPARHPLPPLQGEAGRAHQLGQPDHRHRPEQPGHEPDRAADRAALRQGRQAEGRHAEPRRGRHPRLRPVPELLDPRLRRDAAAGRARGRGRNGARHRRTGVGPWSTSTARRPCS